MTGKDATAGVFSLSGSGSNLSFQFVTGSTTVPDGGSTVALLGIALVGVVGLHRKLRVITA
jgi:VPDSG-CTERM motif